MRRALIHADPTTRAVAQGLLHSQLYTEWLWAMTECVKQPNDDAAVLRAGFAAHELHVACRTLLRRPTAEQVQALALHEHAGARELALRLAERIPLAKLCQQRRTP